MLQILFYILETRNLTKMRASLIEKGIAHPVFPFAYYDQTETSRIPTPPPLPPVPAPPPLPPPRNSTRKSNTNDDIYCNHISRSGTQNKKSVECQTSPYLIRASRDTRGQENRQLQPTITQQPATKHKIRQEELTVYYDRAPFFESFQIYQGYNPNEKKPCFPVTFEPSVMCMHDNDSKTYESIQTNCTSSTEDLVYQDHVTCSEIKQHFCYYIFCCGICCD